MTAKFPPDRSVAAEAAGWIARLQREDRDAELEQDFRSWLRSDPAHAAAFEHATTLWHQLPGVGSVFRQQERQRLGWQQLAMAAAVLMVAGLAWFAWSLRGDTYATAVGEQRLVKLEDGSWITLNTDTVIRARFGGAERIVSLERGEALFDVAKDVRRPFIVHTGSETVRAVGTSFVVRSDGDVVSVALLEGKVLVAPAARALSRTKLKQAAEMTAGSYWRSQDRTVLAMSQTQMDELTAWRHGELIFNNMALRDAVAEMNRYSEVPLVIATPSAGDLRITGVFKVRDHAAFARTVAAVHGLNMVASPQRLLISADGSEH
jgi:transmembrane sensor